MIGATRIKVCKSSRLMFKVIEINIAIIKTTKRIIARLIV